MKSRTKNIDKELAALSGMREEDIDTSDIPEVKDWSGAVVGKFYRPIKEQVCLRLDADVQDGTGELCGICNEPWESLRQRLARLVRSDKLDTNGTGNLRKRT